MVDSRPFDIRFDLESGTNKVRVYAEIKQSISPRQLENIAPWIARLKAIEKDAAFAIVSPALSQQAQAFCIEAGIDFLDLAGNISINVPGKFVLQRTGQRSKTLVESMEGPREVNVFSGRFSRVIRVLLQKPRSWTLSEIAQELERESRDNSVLTGVDVGCRFFRSFVVSLGTISKAFARSKTSFGSVGAGHRRWCLSPSAFCSLGPRSTANAIARACGTALPIPIPSGGI